MKIAQSLSKATTVKHLQQGGVGILATDTLYGLVGRALDPLAVSRIYELKRRQPDKPCIILIARLDDLGLFDIELDTDLRSQLANHWPGPVSVILTCPRADLAYLHRGTNTLAFRLPAKPSLRRLIVQTGPLVAPSANPESLPPASTIKQTRSYFGDAVDFYQPGRTKNKPSRLIKIVQGQITVLRP